MNSEMKTFFLSILSAIIFLASFQNSLLLIDYKINRNFYEIHCINKAKPEMNCHGKCEMKKESEKTNSPFKVVKSFEFNILPTKALEFSFKKVKVVKEYQKFNTVSNFVLNKGFFNILPHPPQIWIFDFLSFCSILFFE